MSPSKNANLRLPSVFGDHMLLQAGKPVRVWGWDRPGQAVSVRVGAQVAETKAGRDGRWEASLSPLEPGGPYVMDVSGSSARSFKDVLAGELWLCSGQSNMEWPLRETERFRQDSPGFDDGQVRILHVPRRVAEEQQDDVEASWKVLTPAVAAGFSAVALYFARKLRRDLGVPVGLIGSYWGGTIIQAWTSTEALKADPGNRPYLARAARARKDLPAGPFDLEVKDLAWERGKQPALPLRASGFRLAVDPTSTARWLDPKGGKWRLQGELYHGGWISATKPLASPPGGPEISGLSFRARGKGRLLPIFNMATVKDWAYHRGPEHRVSGVWKTYRCAFKDLVKPWGDPLEFDPSQLTAFSLNVGDTGNPSQPAWLYNGMLAPLTPLALAGALWYQGESNVEHAALYARQLPDMARDWRRAFREPQLPLLVVQLANFKAPPDRPGASLWAELREAQLKFALRDPRAGLAVTIDIGDAKDIHPRNKREVGRRLALEALAKVYGRDLVSQGPIYERMVAKNGQLRLSFRTNGSPLDVRGGGVPEGFLVAGADRRFVPAEARLEGDEVVLGSAQVAEPLAARYAWSDDPTCNLVNTAGLPASPFRTDDWPVLSTGRR